MSSVSLFISIFLLALAVLIPFDKFGALVFGEKYRLLKNPEFLRVFEVDRG
jgi:hypothetical protein